MKAWMHCLLVCTAFLSEPLDILAQSEPKSRVDEFLAKQAGVTVMEHYSIGGIRNSVGLRIGKITNPSTASFMLFMRVNVSDGDRKELRTIAAEDVIRLKEALPLMRKSIEELVQSKDSVYREVEFRTEMVQVGFANSVDDPDPFLYLRVGYINPVSTTLRPGDTDEFIGLIQRAAQKITELRQELSSRQNWKEF